MSQTQILNKTIAGRSLPISSTTITPVHELEKKSSKDTLEITVFNDDSANQIVELHFNGVLTKFKVPANDARVIGPLAFWGTAEDGTEVVNKNISLKASTADTVYAMGRVVN